MRLFHLAAGMAVALTAVSSAYAQSPAFTPEQRAEGEAIVRVAASYLAANLRDPSAAFFRNVFMLKRTNEPGAHVTICGEVNARNAYGGFTGFERFIYAGKRVYIGTAFGAPVDRMCGRDNPIIDTRDYAPEMREAFAAATGG